MSGKIDPAVQKCIAALQAAKNDTEKMAALFLVTKVVKSPKLGRESRLALFQGIGFKFLLRLLNTPSTEECPSLLYKSVALSILTAFCNDPAIAESQEMLDSIPTFLKIIEDADEDDEDDDQLLIIVSEAYHCLKCLATVEKGRTALIKSGAILRLCEMYAKGAFNAEEALVIIASVGTTMGSRTWENASDQFNDLMERMAIQFESDTSDQKFELCSLMAGIVPTLNMNHEAVTNAFWPELILKGLIDILSSKITEKQRNPALRCASIMLTTLGVDWIIKTTDEGVKEYQFLIILVHLSCIEVRMSLEDRKLDKIMPNDDLIGACYAIIETAVKFMSGTHFENLDEKQKEQVFHALKGAYSAIIGFINLIRKEAEKNPANFWDSKKKMLACASVRCLAAWLAEETTSMKEEVYHQLPFVLALVFETFQDAEYNMSPENQVLAEVGKSIEPLMPEVLVTLLPSLCHLTNEEKGVRMLIDSSGEEFLGRFIIHNWAVYKNLKDLLEKKSRPKKPNKKKTAEAENGEGEELSAEEIKSTLNRIRIALMNTCNLFINMIVLDPVLVAEIPVFQQIMRWSFTSLPGVTNDSDELPLLSNISSLGLLLMLQIIKKTSDAKAAGETIAPEDDFLSSRLISGADNSAHRFGQSVIKFVWDAHLPDESQSPPALILTSAYRSCWPEVKEMWFLSLQTVGSLLESLSWMADFAADSGFLDALIGNLSLAFKNRIDSSTMAAYEDFLCAAAKSSPNAMNIVKTKGAALAKSHHLRALTKVLKGDPQPA